MADGPIKKRYGRKIEEREHYGTLHDTVGNARGRPQQITGFVHPLPGVRTKGLEQPEQ
jgi:hypothetical protein